MSSSPGVIDTRNFAGSYSDLQKRTRLLEQQISNPEIQVGAAGGGTPSFDEVVIVNPGVGDDVVLGFTTVAPTGLGATTSTYLEEVYIDASWTAPTPTPAEYELEIARKLGAGVYDTPRVYRTAGTSVRVIVPRGGQDYGVRVAAINRLGIRSSYTSRIDVTAAVDSTIPPAPTGLTATAGLNSIIVSFDRMTTIQAPDMQNGEGIYRIQLSTNDFAAITAEKFTSSNVESFTGLTQGTNYKVRVAAVDPSGNQGPYATSSNVAPGYVTNTNIATNSINGDRITADTITGAKILAGSIDGDRITANTLDANRIKTSTLTAADITIAGGSLVAGSPITGDGALLNSQGFKLYKDGAVTVNLDALTGDATFTGNLVGSRMYGGEIISANLLGEGQNVNIMQNGHFNTNLTGWTPSAPTNTGAVERQASPPVALNGGVGEAPALRLYSTGGEAGVVSGINIIGPRIAANASQSDLFWFTFKMRAIGNTTGTFTTSINVRWYTAADVFIQSFSVAAFSIVAGTTYATATYNADFSAPANGSKFEIQAVINNVKGGQVWYDDFYVTAAPLINSFQFNTRDHEGSSMVLDTRINTNGVSTHNIFFEEKVENGVSSWDVPSSIKAATSYTPSNPDAAVHDIMLSSGNYNGNNPATFQISSANRVGAGTLFDSSIIGRAGIVQFYTQPKVATQSISFEMKEGTIDLKQTRSSGTVIDTRLWMKPTMEIELYTNTNSGTGKVYLTALSSQLSSSSVSTGRVGTLIVTPDNPQWYQTGSGAMGGPWNIVGGAWTTFPVSGSWAIEAGQEGAGYRRLGDIVYWRGQITNSGTSPSGVCAVMPTSYRPTGNTRRMLGVHQTGVGGVYFCRCDILTNGNVDISNYSASVAGVTVYLGTVSYMAS